jgi:hypothetical protein
VTSQNEIAGLGPSTERPRLNTAIDLTKHKLSPTEGFILSRVDGRSNYDEICMVSGLGREETLRILRDLKHARLILGPGEVAVAASRKGTRAGHPPASEAAPDAGKSGSARAAEAAPPRSQATTKPAAAGPMSADKPRVKAAEPAGSRAGEKARRPPMGPLERLDDGSEVAAGDVVEWPDAPLELKARIVRLHRRLRKLSAWDLLGVGKDADGATVKRAFAAASKELHPDRYFGKNLGSFKAKLVAIFSRLTEAMQEIEESRKGKG